MSALDQSLLRHCPIQSLPNELLDTIIQHLSHVELLQCSQVSTKWFDIISERLLRTECCSLVKDQITCELFNSNDKLIRHLIIRNVQLWESLDMLKVQQLESFYLLCDECTGEDVRKMSTILGKCQNLTQVTLRTSKALNISDLEELLHNMKQVKTLCVMVEHLSEEERKQFLEFFSNVYFFYDEIVLQVMSPCNEIIFICSDKDYIHPHIHNQYSKVILGCVNPKMVETIVNKGTNIKHLEILGRETSDETLAILSATPHYWEHLTLDNFSNTTQAWGTFFKNLDRDGHVLREMTLSKCDNITNEDLSELGNLCLNKLDIDLCDSPKITNIKSFLLYCLSHVLQLKVSFIYNENVLNNFIDVFHTFCNDKVDLITKHVDIEILRVNHCSEKISNQIEGFKLKLDHLANKCSVSVNVEEMFSRISQNM